MFGAKIGLHVIKFPSGRFGYVGSLPTSCCRRVKATMSGIMGGRAIREGKGLFEYSSMVFGTQKEAIEHATSLGLDPKLPMKV
jgi:hypothetical protein